MLLFYFPGFLLTSLGVVLLRRRPAAARALYRVLLLGAVLPYVLHARHTWGWVSEVWDPQPRVGIYPGLVAFGASTVLIAASLLALAWALVRRHPLATAALPPALWLLYWYVSLRLLFWRAPEFAPLDNKPVVWLLATSVFATPLLFLAAWGALRNPSRAMMGPSLVT